MKAHSYPFYVDDWYAKETWLSMTCEERGIFRELLDHAYQEGSLPASPEVLQRRCGANDEEWRRSSPKPLSRFQEEGGRLTHPKVTEIRERISEWKLERSGAGKRGASKRWQKDGSANGSANGSAIGSAIGSANGSANGSAIGSAMREPIANRWPSTSTSTSTSTEKTRAGNRTNDSGSPEALRFIEDYPKRTGTQIGIQTYLSVVEPDEHAAVLEGLDRWKRSEAWTRDAGRFIPEPGKWLSDRRWAEYPAPAQTTGGYETPIFKEAF